MIKEYRIKKIAVWLSKSISNGIPNHKRGCNLIDAWDMAYKISAKKDQRRSK